MPWVGTHTMITNGGVCNQLSGFLSLLSQSPSLPDGPGPSGAQQGFFRFLSPLLILAFRCGRLCCYSATLFLPLLVCQPVCTVLFQATGSCHFLHCLVRGVKGIDSLAPRTLTLGLCNFPCQQQFWSMGDASFPWEEGESIFLPRVAHG